MFQFTKRDVQWITKLIVIIFLLQTAFISGFTLIAMQELAARDTRNKIRHLGSSIGRLYGSMNDREVSTMKETLRKGYRDYTKTEPDLEGFARNLGGNEQGFWWDFRLQKFVSTNGFPIPGNEISFIPQDTGSLKLYDAYVRFGYTNREAMIKVLREWEMLYHE